MPSKSTKLDGAEFILGDIGELTIKQDVEIYDEDAGPATYEVERHLTPESVLALRQFLRAGPTEVTLTLSENDTLVARVPSGGASARFPDGTYPVEVPISENGLMVLLRILQEQRRLGKSVATVGSPAAPTVSQVEAWLRAGNKVRQFDAKGAEKVTLEDLDLL